MLRHSTHLVPAGHPCIAGHFPGYPTVPAVVILNSVRRAMTEWDRSLRIRRLHRVKFLQPLLPEEGFGVTLETDDLREFSFLCRKENGTEFAAGEFTAELV